MRNHFKVWGILSIVLVALLACDDTVTYSEMKEKEIKLVKNFIAQQKINVISYEEFIKDTITETTNGKNEYVEIDGCYLQILRNPKSASDGRQMNEGEIVNMIARYYEYNISEADTISGNINDTDNPDIMRVKYEYGVYSASFTDGYMKAIYGDAVPQGWLVPLQFLYFTRHQSQAAKVNVIVPHTKGTSEASSYVYPCFYQITFTPENWYDTN